MPERSADYWLKKAEEARTRAAGMHSQDAIDTMLDIAARYDAMAQQAEEVRARTKSKKPPTSN